MMPMKGTIKTSIICNLPKLKLDLKQRLKGHLRLQNHKPKLTHRSWIFACWCVAFRKHYDRQCLCHREPRLNNLTQSILNEVTGQR